MDDLIPIVAIFFTIGVPVMSLADFSVVQHYDFGRYQLKAPLARSLSAGDQKGPPTQAVARRSDPSTYVAVPGPLIANRILTHQAGQGHDLTPGDQLAGKVSISP